MMATSTEYALRRLLVHYQISSLQSQNYTSRGQSVYEEALEQAGLSTPREILQLELKQLEDLLGKSLLTQELRSLLSAARTVAGALDADKFDTVTDFQDFAQDNNFAEVAQLAPAIWDLGLENCAAISRLVSFDLNGCARLLNLQQEDPVDNYKLGRLDDFAKIHATMFDLESVLRTPLPEPYVRIKSSSASQADIMHGKHPSAVRVWDNFQGVVQTHVGNMKSTKKRFVQSSSATDQGAAGEDYVSRVFGSAIGRPINAGIKYYKRQDWLEGEGKVHALWESQGSHTPTDPEVAGNLRSAHHNEVDAATREAARNVRARAAASNQVSIRSVNDSYLREEGNGRARAVVEFKRIERLGSPGWRKHRWENQAPPPLVDIWNNPKVWPKGLSQNVIGVIEQVNQYASENGIRYCLIFTHQWSWALEADGSNNLSISPAFRYDATGPSVKHVVDFISHQALKESGLWPTWDTLLVHPPSETAPDPSGGPSTGPQQPPSRSARDPSRRPPTGKRSHGSSQPPHGAVALGPAEGADPPGTLQSVLSPYAFGHAVRDSKEAIRLAEEAAALEENMIKGVLGRGALGAVFEARMPCGRLVALKLAPPGSPEEDMLRKEAMVYLVLQELWNKDVPELLLAGPLRAFRSGYALGTCLSPGRPLQEGDADLLPAALAILANVHARGIIHGDLREENFLVNEAGIAMGGAKTIMLFDFSHSSIDSDKEAQAYEVDEMVDLFESL